MTTVHHDALRAVNGVLLPGFTGTDAPVWVLAACEEGLAGVIYFAQNTPDVATTARLSARLHEASPDLLVAIDEEGGDVSRLEAATGSSIPGAAALGTRTSPNGSASPSGGCSPRPAWTSTSRPCST
jgi:beta-N-acetylhexosaminidase